MDDITLTITIPASTLTANDNAPLKDLGEALGVTDPTPSTVQTALQAWVMRRIEIERNRGSELRLARETSSTPLFPS